MKYVNLHEAPTKKAWLCLLAVILLLIVIGALITPKGISERIREGEILEVWYANSRYGAWKYTLSDPDTIRAVRQYINKQNATPAEDRSNPEYGYPLIGFRSRRELGQNDSYWASEATYFCALYSEGVLEVENDSIWEIELLWEDLKPLLDNAAKTKTSLVEFPHLFPAATAGGGWNTRLLTLADTTTETEYRIEICSMTAEKLNVLISNPKEVSTNYYVPVRPIVQLQTMVNGSWYQIPDADIYYAKWNEVTTNTILAPGETKAISVSIFHWNDYWNSLPAGHYRWVWQSGSYEFDI